MMLPAVGRSRPIIDFSTVLLPQPLPPMTAKMLPLRTSNDRSCWMTFGPKARGMPFTDSRARRRRPDIGGTAPRLQSDAAACDSDQDGKGDALDEAKEELIERDGV